MTTTVLERFVRWNLDYDGDLYGDDERERLRWYEGIATAGKVQVVAIPWVAAIAVWVVGEPVVPLMLVLVAQMLPTAIGAIYVRSRQVDTTPHSWSPKRLVLSVLGGLPIVVFVIGALRVLSPDGRTDLPSTVFGATFGLAIGVAVTAVQVRRRRRQDAAAIADED